MHLLISNNIQNLVLKFTTHVINKCDENTTRYYDLEKMNIMYDFNS